MNNAERIPLFDGLYEITEDGKLFSTRSGKFLRPRMDRYGYFYYVISINSVRYTLKAHRLVAQAFLPNPEEKPTVNHKNGVRSDNRKGNLEWATYKEQSADPLTTQKRNTVVSNTDYRAMGELRNFGRRRTAVYEGNVLLGIYESLKEAAYVHSVSIGRASMCANGVIERTGGVRFCYV